MYRVACSCLVLVLVLVAARSVAVIAAPRPDPEPAPAYRLIVNPELEVTTLERHFVADVFLKKITRWPNGKPIRPVDLEAGSRTRARFSDSVIKRTVESVKSYWAQHIFTGRGLPPPELRDDEAVVAYVVEHAGSIGYVSGTSDIGAARVVTVK